MVITTAEPVDAANAQPVARRRWRRWLVAGLAAVLVLAGVAGVAWWRYAATYDPLHNGNTAGPYGPDRDNFARFDTDLGTVIYVRGPDGSSTGFLSLIENDGSHDVVIQGVDSYFTQNVQWSPYILIPGGNGSGKNVPSRSFPATVPAHSTIRLILTLRRPACSNNQYEFGHGTTGVLHWTALGVHHTKTFDLLSHYGTYVGCPRYVPKDDGS